MLRISLGVVDKLIWTDAEAETPGGTPINLTDDPVKWAFTIPGQRPVLSDWKDGVWSEGHPAYAITPAAIGLALGVWDVWIKITDSPQVDEEKFDQLTIY
jgi:hypothetical protein